MEPRLADLQRLLCRLITAPNGVAEGLSTEKNLPPEGIAALVVGARGLSAVERVEIYANMYFYRLLEAIKEDFPATFTILGEVDFHNLITGYLIQYPPSHPSITEASRYLAQFADNCLLLRNKPFVSDLIRLERALVEVFLSRDQIALGVDELREIPPQQWPSLRIGAHPATQLLDCQWRVDQVLQAVELGQSVVSPMREPRSILVWRNNCAVSYRALDEAERIAFAVIRRGDEFKVLCEAVAAESGDAAAPEVTNKMLSRWLADGILVRL